MSPGQIARRVLGPAFVPVGEAYRRIFVDMAKVADWMGARLPPNARVLDIGGGDGYVVELLLRRRADIHVTMTDVAPHIGSFLSAETRARVTLLPGTDAANVSGNFDAVTIADVLHHVPIDQRPTFLAMVGTLARRIGAGAILVKDIRPRGLRAALSLWSDLYVTGDKGVSLIGEDGVRFPDYRRAETAMPDFPNYCLRFERIV